MFILYEFSLGLNGLGLCATQYASAWMTADIYRDGYHYHLVFHILQASPLNSVPVLPESLPACFPGLFCFLSGAYFYFAIRAVICVSR